MEIIIAVWEMHGANTKISAKAIMRSRRVSNTRIPITAGTLQPKPNIIGNEPYPCKPTLWSRESKSTARRGR